MMIVGLFNNEVQGGGGRASLSPYILDFFFFVLLTALFMHFVMEGFYGAFFAGESSGAFMQFTYYVHALGSSESLYWDHYLMLASQEMPMSPLLSPVTLILTGAAYLFKITEPSSLIYLYAFASYAVQVLCCYTMYLFLRFLGLSRLAAIVGGVGYGFNFFTSTFGMPHGYYRLSALAIMPVVFIYFFKLFSKRSNNLYYLTVAGFLLGLAFVLNGDVKPTIYFIPILVLVAYAEGFRVHGSIRTTWLLGGVLLFGALITLAQYYPTYEALKEGVRGGRTQYLPGIPLMPLNTLLGFSQNPFSMIIGFFFPHSFFEYYKSNLTLGITYTHLSEGKFTYGIFLFLLATAGVFYRTRRHLVWALSFLVFALYVLGSSTPLWPLFGFISKYSHIRYPTRGAIILYFFLSIYAAYGVDVITRSAKSDFYRNWAARYLKYTAAFSLLVISAIVMSSLQIHYGSISPLAYTDLLTLFVARLLLILLIFTLVCIISMAWRSSPLAGGAPERRDDIGARLIASLAALIRGSQVVNYIPYVVFHGLLIWLSLKLSLYLLKAWLQMTKAGADELSAIFFVEATFLPALIVFMIFYLIVFILHRRRDFILPVKAYCAVFILSLIALNILFHSALIHIRIVHALSLVIISAGIYLSAITLKRIGPVDLDEWRRAPRFIRHTAPAVYILFFILFALFLFSGLARWYGAATYLIVELGPIKIQRELLYVLIGLILFYLSVLLGRRGGASAIVILAIAAGSYLFIYTDSTAIVNPPSIKAEPSLVFKRDAELATIYEEERMDELRIYIPSDVRHESLSPELGFAKSHHSYCCRQYEDRLRFAFGQIVGPKTLEKIRRTIYDDYSHPFWRLYNVGYIVDTFNENPELLPSDRDSYVRLSDMVIRLKGVKPLLYFTDSFKVVDRAEFAEKVSKEYALDMERVLYLHDEPKLKAGALGGAEAQVEIKEVKSGMVEAQVMAARPGFVVFSEVWAPSWTVYVNGEERPVLKAYGMLQAVEVGGGRSHIRFDYNPFHSSRMKAAVVLSALALLLVLVLIARRLLCGLSPEDEEPTGG